VVVPVAGRVVEHLHAHLLAALVRGVEHTAGLEVVRARELLLASVKVHLVTPFEEHVHRQKPQLASHSDSTAD
jgi:hypothetical protein